MKAYQDAIALITKQFNLPTQENVEDWELMVADPARVEEFIAYMEKNNDLADPVKHLLLSVILFSYDDLLSEDNEVEENYWERIIPLADRDIDLHHDTLTYWAMWEDYGMAKDDPFAITPLVRQFMIERKRPRKYLKE